MSGGIFQLGILIQSVDYFMLSLLRPMTKSKSSRIIALHKLGLYAILISGHFLLRAATSLFSSKNLNYIYSAYFCYNEMHMHYYYCCNLTTNCSGEGRLLSVTCLGYCLCLPLLYFSQTPGIPNSSISNAQLRFGS